MQLCPNPKISQGKGNFSILIFKLYNKVNLLSPLAFRSMDYSTGMYLSNHHHNLDTDQFHHPKKFPLWSYPSHTTAPITTNLFSRSVLIFLENVM